PPHSIAERSCTSRVEGRHHGYSPGRRRIAEPGTSWGGGLNSRQPATRVAWAGRNSGVARSNAGDGVASGSRVAEDYPYCLSPYNLMAFSRSTMLARFEARVRVISPSFTMPVRAIERARRAVRLVE